MVYSFVDWETTTVCHTNHCIIDAVLTYLVW